jgi:folylpolyglutamate synthase/dihydropteroate synthase
MAGCDALAGATVVCTSPDLSRALPARELAAAWEAAGIPGLRAIAAETPATALDLALATGDGTVVVAGSLYLVGAARARLVEDPALRDPEAP